VDYHPTHCNLFTYSNNLGEVKLFDMRQSAHLNRGQIFASKSKKNNSVFDAITDSISDAKFTRDGRYLVARDYFNMRIWVRRSEPSNGFSPNEAEQLCVQS